MDLVARIAADLFDPVGLSVDKSGHIVAPDKNLIFHQTIGPSARMAEFVDLVASADLSGHIAESD
jgi:hypothetical protein